MVTVWEPVLASKVTCIPSCGLLEAYFAEHTCYRSTSTSFALGQVSLFGLKTLFEESLPTPDPPASNAQSMAAHGRARVCSRSDELQLDFLLDCTQSADLLSVSYTATLYVFKLCHHNTYVQPDHFIPRAALCQKLMHADDTEGCAILMHLIQASQPATTHLLDIVLQAYWSKVVCVAGS